MVRGKPYVRVVATSLINSSAKLVTECLHGGTATSHAESSVPQPGFASPTGYSVSVHWTSILSASVTSVRPAAKKYSDCWVSAEWTLVTVRITGFGFTAKFVEVLAPLG